MTTTTGSATASPLPSRRNLIAHAGMLAAMTATGASALALPALAEEPGPIEAMWPEYLRLEAALDAATERFMDAEDLYEEPDRPRWHPVHEAGGYITIMKSPGRGIAVLDHGPENIAYLKDAIAREHQPDTEEYGQTNKVRARRARKTLAKIEAWQVEVRRRKDVAGLTEAAAADKAATAARRAHCDAIFAIKAATYRELAFQAAVLDSSWRQEWAEHVLERLTELAAITPYGLG